MIQETLRGTDGYTSEPMAKSLMLVSANADTDLRSQVIQGLRPRPEFLLLEHDHDVELLDWSRLKRPPQGRTSGASLRHASVAVARWPRPGAILSDGEHVGIPLAAALALTPRRPGHVVIGHHLTTAQKRRLLSLPLVARGVDTFVVHSQNQADLLIDELRLPVGKVQLVPYGVDTDFWSPRTTTEQALVFSPGREHRDHATLAAAVGDLDVQVLVTDGSAHSPAATRRLPEAWPKNMSRRSVPFGEIRSLYARAAVVVVPLVETDFPAGISVVVEAMSMGCAVVVTGTSGLRGAIGDPGSVVTVPPGDAPALRREIAALLDDPARAVEIGSRARRVAQRHHSATAFAANISRLLERARIKHG